MPWPYSMYAPKAFPLVSRNCTIGIGPAWCGGDPVEWVNGVHVTGIREDILNGGHTFVTKVFR